MAAAENAPTLGDQLRQLVRDAPTMPQRLAGFLTSQSIAATLKRAAAMGNTMCSFDINDVAKTMDVDYHDVFSFMNKVGALRVNGVTLFLSQINKRPAIRVDWSESPEPPSILDTFRIPADVYYSGLYR
jgi:hypothetical protein